MPTESAFTVAQFDSTESQSMRLPDDKVADSASDVVQLMIAEAAIDQRELALRIAEFMRRQGWERSASAGNFCKLANNETGLFYQYVDMIAAIVRHSGKGHWMVMYLADLCAGNTGQYNLNVSLEPNVKE